MLFGADVTHPAPGSEAASIAAVVGSVDLAGGRYAARLSVQPATQETIGGLDTLSADLLRQFAAATRFKPDRIIFFRDGVRSVSSPARPRIVDPPPCAAMASSRWS